MKTQQQYEAEELPDTYGLKRFTDAYIEAAFFTEGGPDNPDFEAKSLGDIAPEALQRINDDCRAFYNINWKLINGNVEQAGHDFWFTRNGHGVGFWDREEVYSPAGAKALTAACKAMGGMDLYIGDDGRIYAL